MVVIICNQIYFFTYDEGQRRGHSKNRVIDHWNALSDACVTNNTINQFKNCLKREFEMGTATGNT